MRPALDRSLRKAAFRCHVNILARWLGWGFLCAGSAAAAVALAERLLGMPLFNAYTAGGLAAAAALAAVALWYLRRPSRLAVALLIDERLALRERFSTAVALSVAEDPFAAAARDDARRTAEHIRVKAGFPVRLPRTWLGAGGTWMAALCILAYVPAIDLFGYGARRTEEKVVAKQLEEARAEVKTTAEAVELSVQQIGAPDLKVDLAALTHPTPGLNPGDVRREAIKRLSDLSDQVRQLRDSDKLAAQKATEEMLKRLHTTQGGLSPELDHALARSDFGEAARRLEEIRQKMETGNLSEKDREALARQLDNLSRQLQQLAKAGQESARSELQKQGLDPSMANLDPDSLREQLEKQGLSQEKIDEIMKKLSALQQAGQNCQGLGDAMDKLAQGQDMLTGDQLDQLIQALDQMGEIDRQDMAAQAALAQIEAAIARLGEGEEGGKGKGLFSEGQSFQVGLGTGGPGRGQGARETGPPEPTGTEKTGVKNEEKKGPAIASWYFKGPQVKGEARREYAEVVKAAKDRAAEAISDKEIPKKYEGAVKAYFDNLEQIGQEP